jgi:hypothetical protein
MKIIHRCATCNFPEEYHPFVKAFSPECSVPKTVIKQQPSELVPTIDSAGRINETVFEPGSIWPGGHPRVVTCDCQSCWDLYRTIMSEEMDHETVG